MKQIWLEKDGTLQVLTDENLDDVKRVLVTRKGSIYGSLYYPDEKPKGKWITDKSGNIICSACKWYAPKVMKGCFTTRRLEYSKTDFCGHCGADMREEEDNGTD